MKKNVIAAIMLASFGTLALAQEGRIGINTSDPKTTMDIRGKTDGSGVSLATDATGLQAPRLTRAELTSKGNTLYGADQQGAMVYITDISGGDATSQRVNITAKGYYYFDGSVWQVFRGSVLSSDSSAWNLQGNAGTTRGTNFIGTTDNTDLMVKTNGKYRMHFNNHGGLVIGDSTEVYNKNMTNAFSGIRSEFYNTDIVGGTGDPTNPRPAFGIANSLTANIKSGTSSTGSIRSLTTRLSLAAESGGSKPSGDVSGASIFAYREPHVGATDGTGNIARMAGLNIAAGHNNGAAGTTTNFYGINLEPYNQGTGIITNYYGYYMAQIAGGGVGTGTITNKYGVYIDNLFTNYFKGSLGIGTTAGVATNQLHVAATANPVRFEGLKTGAATDNIVTVDATGVLKTLSASAVGSSAEPWYNTATSTPATANTQNIYQTGKVSTGFDNPLGYDFGHQLNVKGHISTKRWGTAPNFVQTRYNGTEAAPTAVLLDDQVGAISFEAFAGGGMTGTRPSVANITSWAAENTTSTASAGKLVFATVPVGSITPNQRLTITETGNVGIGLPSSVGLLRPSNPTNKLHVSATANPVRFEGLVAAAATDNLVTIDANGVLTKSTATAASSANNWGLTGNAGTTIGTNFLGTTDAQGLIFKVNNFQSGYIDPTIENTSFGYNAGIALTSGVSNTAFGYRALSNTTTSNSNSAFGNRALLANTTGRQNTAIGMEALIANTTGISNTALGEGSLYKNTTGTENTAIGKDALYENVTGLNNTALGTSALGLSTGHNNVGVGYYAGRFLTAGDRNIAIGYLTELPSATGSNQMNIGNTIFGTGMNGTLAAPAGRIGIGVSTLDFAKLDTRETLIADATGLSGTNYIASNGALTLNHSAASSNQTYRGLNGSVTTPATNATNFTNRLYGGSASVNHQGSGAIAQAVGFYGATFQNNASSVIANNFGVIAEVRVNNGLSNSMNGIFASVVSDPTSTIKQPVAVGVRGDVNADGAGMTTAYGFSATASKLNNVDNYYSYFVHSSAETTASTGNKYAFYNNANINSWFKGSLGIGTAAGVANAKLHVVKAASDLTPAIIEGCQEYADNTTAAAAGLPVGAIYRTSTGILMVRF